MTFEEARGLMRSFNFKSKTFYDEYFRNNKRPIDFPSTPYTVYFNKGWKDWGDFLGTNTIATFRRKYLPFSEAKKFVHNLKLKNNAEWLIYLKSGQKPENIPAKPMRTYEKIGWISIGDWLGTGVLATDKKEFLSYENAKKVVKKLQFSNIEDWKKYTKSENFPDYLPKAPHSVYSKKGEWISYGDWLGTNRIATNDIKFKSYDSAVKLVHKLKILTNKEWVIYSKSGKLPADIPKAPAVVYKNKGWKTWGDWLGTNRVSTKENKYFYFKVAKNLLFLNGIKTQMEYHVFRKKNASNCSLPSRPQNTYKNKGWKDWADFLGKEGI
jgi:hypothetical protein